MRNTVVILNEELGSISLGFEEAGFEILCAFEEDRKAYKLYKDNFKSPVIGESILNVNLYDIPKSDVIAGKLRMKDMEYADRRDLDCARVYYSQKIIFHNKPKCFLFEINKTAIKTNIFNQFVEALSADGYEIMVRLFDVSKHIGYPVREEQMYLVGVQHSVSKQIYFEKTYERSGYSIREFLQEYKVDPWYHNIDYSQIHQNFRENVYDINFLCWKTNGYVPTELVSWNTVKVPLVNIDSVVRKLTHYEVAKLKGYSPGYILDISNKQWLYRKLMNASNVRLVYSIAQSIENALDNRVSYNQQLERGGRFESLFVEFFQKKDVLIKQTNKPEWDFVVTQDNESFCFELKIYTNKVVSVGQLTTVCKRLKQREIGDSGRRILILGNVVEADLRKKFEDEYGIAIWDVANILYLFDPFPELKNNFIAILNYTVSDIEMICPIPNLFGISYGLEGHTDYAQRLNGIKLGIDESAKYEEFCVDILKELFGEYLTWWNVQQKSNDGLYRFDLCCKIKHGENHEFFDTIRQFFNTKYIVFEFKNYEKMITQKEIYTTEKYLYKTALRSVAIIISRNGANDNAIKAARGCLRENGKLILCLSDDDIKKLIDIKQVGEIETPEVLSNMLDEMLIELEK